MWMILFKLRKQRNFYWRRRGNGRRRWKRGVWEWMLERQKSCGVGWAWVRLRILESIHVVFAGRELAITQSFVWSVVGGFTKDVVAFQESWRVMLIFIAGGVWRVRMTSFSKFCWKRLWLSPMWSLNVFPISAFWATHLGREESVASPWGNGWVQTPHFCSEPSWDLCKSVEKYFIYLGGVSCMYIVTFYWSPANKNWSNPPLFLGWQRHWEELWKKQQGALAASSTTPQHSQGPEWDVLGQSSRSYLLSWQPRVHHTVQRERYTRLVSRVHWHWHMGLKPGRWRKRICKVWRGRNGWWWEGWAECRWRIGNAVWIYTVFWVYRWWGRVDWGGLGMWNVRG